MKRKLIGSIVAGVLIVSTGLGLIASTTKVKAGYVGVVYNMRGGVEDKTLPQGFHLVSPTKSVVKYSVATEQAFLSKDTKEGSKEDDSFLIPTSDGKTVNVDLEFSYHFDAEKLPQTFTKFKGQDGKTIEETFIRGKIKAWAGEIASKFSVLEIYGEKRADLNKAVYEHVKNNFNQYGIVIDSVNFSRIGLDAATEKAIQDRINAQQTLEKAKIEKQQAEIEAEKQKIQAQGEADAKFIKAQGESKANKELQQSLTKELVDYKRIEKWDGKLSQVQGGTPIINIGENK